MIAADKPPLEDVYLAHFGIKGMRWGHRKQVPLAGPRQSSSASQADAVARQHKVMKAAAIGGGVVLAAVLLRRGGVNLVDARSARVYASGAKATGNILFKTGKTIVKTSAKLTPTVGKGTVKGVAKVGTLAGKGAYKGSIAAGKGIGQGTAKSGVEFYNRVLKKSAASTVKVGSKAMARLSGRGQPVVEEAAKSSIFKGLSPVDLLLNTRADMPRRNR